MSVLTTRAARVAALSRDRADSDPILLDARRELAVEQIAVYVERVVAEAPPLTEAQRDRLAGLMRTPRG